MNVKHLIMRFFERMPIVTDISPYMGCDPEFFFKLDGQVIGAEKFLPKDGLVFTDQSKFIIDGVQAELNPRPSYCRANLANEIKQCFQLLQTELKKRGKGITCDFSRTVEITKENLMELDEKSRKFGCAPSKSIYKKLCGLKIDKVNPEEYRTRAAGGHIHIGKTPVGSPGLTRALVDDHERTVAMLDLLCGNTAVLVDRDKGNIERRKVYGKAGEYRLPKHGLEYRTLSNFWLTSYPLMSFAFGMARLAVQLMADTKNHELFFKEFTSKVKTKNVHTAINENDFDLAMENFMRIESLIAEVSGPTEYVSDRYAISRHNIKQFHHFVDKIQADGLEYWFPQDPLTHWTSIAEAHRGGFHDYLLDKVNIDMKKANKKAA